MDVPRWACSWWWPSAGGRIGSVCPKCGAAAPSTATLATGWNPTKDRAGCPRIRADTPHAGTLCNWNRFSSILIHSTPILKAGVDIDCASISISSEKKNNLFGISEFMQKHDFILKIGRIFRKDETRAKRSKNNHHNLCREFEEL